MGQPPESETPLVRELANLKPHDHLCLIYESQEEWKAAIIPFMRIGLERGDRCCYVADVRTAEELRAHLRKDGVNIASVESSGQLVILHKSQAYTRGGLFDPDLMIKLLVAETERAISQGYPALRVTGEMTWALKGITGSERLLEYEAKLNRDFFPKYPCLGICQYNRWKSDPEIIKGVIMTHPLVVCGGNVYHNFYYISSEEFLDHRRAEREAEHWLNNIEREHRIRQELMESRERYAELFSNLKSGVAVYQAVDEGNDFIFVDFNRGAERIEGLDCEEVIGKRATDIFPRVREFGLFNVFQRVWHTGKPEHHGISFYQDNRIAGWRDNYVYKLSTGEIVSVYEDVTARKAAEAELELRAQILDSANDAVFLTDMNGHIRYVNARACETLGYTKEELLSKKLRDIDSPEYAARIGERVAEIRETGESLFESEHRRSDGSVFPVEVHARLIQAKGTELIVAVARDISERRRAEATLRESEASFHDLYDNAPIAYFSIDSTGHIIQVNKAVCQWLGYTPEELIGKHRLAIFAEESQKKAREVAQRFDRGEIVKDEEMVYQRKDGQKVYGLLSFNPIRDDKGRVIASRSVVKDITERNKAEEALKKSEEKYRSLVNNVRLGILRSVTTGEGKALEVNPAFEEITGYSRDELLAMGFSKLYVYPEERRAILDALAATNEPVTRELHWRRKDGRVIVVLDKATAVRDNTGQIVYVDAIIEDITERKKAEEALKKRDEFLDHVIENTPNALWISDEDGTAMRMNQALRDLLKIKDEEIVGKYNIFKDVQVIEQGYLPLVKSAFEEGKTVNFTLDYDTAKERQVALSEHTHKLLEIVISSIRDQENRIIHAIIQEKDITEQKRAQEALRRAEQNFRNSLDNSPLGIRIVNADGKALYANQALLDMYGYDSLEEMNATPARKRYTPEGYAEYQKRRNKRKRGEFVPDSYVIDIVRKDGKIRQLEVHRKEVRWNGKSQTQVLYQDVTEREEMKKALEASENNYRALFDNTSATVIVEEDTTISLMNSEFVRLFGYAREEIEGKRSWTEFVFPADLEKMKQYHRRRREDESAVPSQYEARLIDRQGQIRNVALTVRVIPGTKRSVVSVLDLTERKKIEERLILTDRLASIGELASGMAHELNNPLTGVIGFSEMLMRQDLPEEAKENAKIVYREAQRTAEVVKNLLTFARKHPPLKQTLNINDVVKKVLELRAYEQKVSNINVVSNLASDLPETMADYFQLQQVFLNIVINAEYFMTEAHSGGTLTVTTKLHDNIIGVSFEDDGPGIAPEVLSHIFDPFYTTKPVGKGTGLGLSICHGIVSEHGGRIYAESEPSKGATFTVELPVTIPGEE